MLINFSVGNYLSFKDIQTLNLIPEALKEFPNNLLIPYLYNSEDRLLKSIAVYGHNSYGKSNLLKSFKFFFESIFQSFINGQTRNKLDTEPFRLNVSMKDKPTFFEITFLVKETKYRYRYQMTSSQIVEEGLYYAEVKVRENYLFERIGQEIKISKLWNKESANQLDQLTSFCKPHILFLSVLISQTHIPRINDIGRFLTSHVFISENYYAELKRAREIYSDMQYRSLILRFIERADLGFTTIFDKVENISKAYNKELISMWYDSEINNFNLYTQHVVFNDEKREVSSIEFELQKSESAGTIKYFIIVCLLAYAIKNSNLIFIDELDARFDSSLLEMLVKAFHDAKINPVNSQMIFTTHNTVLLDRKLRRDQMIVVDKNEWGESTLTKVHSAKKPVRIGKSIEKEYREGNLGGTSKRLKDDFNPTLF